MFQQLRTAAAGESEPGKVVELIDVRKIYRTAAGAFDALAGVSAQFLAGTYTAVMGPSGSGKSTLLQCAAGLDPVSSGDVRIGGVRIGGLKGSALTILRRDQIGFIFQAFNLIPSLTARQNVELPRRLAGKRASRSEVDAVLADVGLTDRAGHVVVPAGGDSLSAATVAALRKVPDVQVVPVVDIVLYVGTRGGGFIDSLNAQAVSAGSLPGVEHPTVLSGSLRGFGSGSLVVDEKAARADGLRVGMRLAVWGPDGTRRNVTLTAIVATGLSGDLCYVSTGVVHGVAPARVDVKVLSGADLAVAGKALLAAVRGQPATVLTRAQEVTAMNAASHKQSRSTTILVLGIALVYSLIAIANTMVMAGAGRRKELAALNLAGVTKRQILGYVAAESLLSVVLGAIVAAVSAVPVLIVMLLDLTGLIGSFPISLPWETVGAVGVTCAVIGVLASAITAGRAIRGRVVELAGLRE